MTSGSPQPQRLGIIGTGRIAHAHAAAIARSSRAELAAVFDPDTRRARAFARETGASTVRTGLSELLADDLDGVIICSPTQFHAAQGAQALEAGVPILVEKPFAANGQSAQRLVEAGESRGLSVMAAQVVRFMPTVQLARKVIDSGEFGQPVQAIERRLTYRTENYPWWQDLPAFLVAHWGSHSLDVVTHLVSGVVDSVYSVGRSVMSDYGVVDDFSLIARYRDGFRFTSSMSFASRATRHDLLLVGGDATIELEEYRRVRVNDAVRLELSDEEVHRRAFDAQLTEFLDSLQGRGAGISPGRTVLHGLAALDAAERSIGSGVVERVR